MVLIVYQRRFDSDVPLQQQSVHSLAQSYLHYSYTIVVHHCGVGSSSLSRSGVALPLHCSRQPRSCLHHLVPPPRDPALLSRLTALSKCPHTNNRTKIYQSLYPTPSTSIRPVPVNRLVCVILFHCSSCFYFLCYSASVDINKYTYIHHASCGDCVEDKRKDCYNCSVM